MTDHKGMQFFTRLVLWLSSGFLVFLADMVTKAAPHSVVLHNTSHAAPVVYAAVAIFLALVALWHSNAIALGAGLMLGAFCGNLGELMMLGYATDWIRIGHWYTNVADLAGAAGFMYCCTTYITSVIGRPRPPSRSTRNASGNQGSSQPTDNKSTDGQHLPH